MKEDEADVRILYIEDDETDQMLFRRIWKKLITREPEMAPNGSVAIQLLEDSLASGEALPSLIFLDLNMPVKDGYETLKDIKADQRMRHIPVIVLSTSNQQRDVDLCYGLHANAYICKDIDHKKMVAAHANAFEFWCKNNVYP